MTTSVSDHHYQNKILKEKLTYFEKKTANMQNNISNNSEKTINENKNLRDQLKNKITRIAFLESQNMKLEKRISTFVNEKGGLTENQEQ